MLLGGPHGPCQLPPPPVRPLYLLRVEGTQFENFKSELQEQVLKTKYLFFGITTSASFCPASTLITFIYICACMH